VGRRGSPARARYGRVAALAAAVTVTGVAVLGSAGVLPVTDDAPRVTSAAVDPVAALPSDQPAGSPSAELSDESLDEASGPKQVGAPAPDDEVGVPGADTALPSRSGQGRRVVYSESRQRVWLVGEDGPRRTYLVSGSVYDNLDPGAYEVYSRSEQAWGIDDSGTMRWFVRFTQGENAAIGFHDIPVDDGRKVQDLDELGTPLSHGCIRQRTEDAKALWDFAPLGTPVVVTA